MATSTNSNISLYLVFRVVADAQAWLPIFFLFFSEHLSLSEILVLESIYYVAVVGAEVPSGYLSDVLGRRLTLLLSATAKAAAYLFFLTSESFIGFACGQGLLAVGIACRSGTDTALHYESLAAAGRGDEYGDREALAGQYGFLATAVAALAGGILGSFDLSWPYWFSLATAIAMFVIVWQFVEPSHSKGTATEWSVVKQLGACVAYLRSPLLAWIFAFYVVMYVIVHVPFEFYQPYLDILDSNNRLAGYSAPFAAGVIFALTALVGSWAAGQSMKWRHRLGLFPLLGTAAAIELIVIAALAFVLHPALAALVLLRNGPMAVVSAPIRSTIAPHIDDRHRATYLSVQSLAARLAFAGMLAGLSTLIPAGQAVEWEALSTVLRVAFVSGLVCVAVLMVTARRVRLS